jgi:hypothetical protein
VNGIVGQSQVTVVTGDTGNPVTAYGFFTESLPRGMKFDVANNGTPPNGDGGKLSLFPDDHVSIKLLSTSGAGQFTEGTSGLEADVDFGASTFAGYTMSFGVPLTTTVSKDLSAYIGGNVRFDMKAPAGATIKLKMQSTDGGSTEIPIDPGQLIFDGLYFHSISFPLSTFSGVTFSLFQSITITAFGSSGNYSFFLDNLRFEQ